MAHSQFLWVCAKHIRAWEGLSGAFDGERLFAAHQSCSWGRAEIETNPYPLCAWKRELDLRPSMPWSKPDCSAETAPTGPSPGTDPSSAAPTGRRPL